MCSVCSTNWKEQCILGFIREIKNSMRHAAVRSYCTNTTLTALIFKPLNYKVYKSYNFLICFNFSVRLSGNKTPEIKHFQFQGFFFIKIKDFFSGNNSNSKETSPYKYLPISTNQKQYDAHLHNLARCHNKVTGSGSRNQDNYKDWTTNNKKTVYVYKYIVYVINCCTISQSQYRCSASTSLSVADTATISTWVPTFIFSI